MNRVPLLDGEELDLDTVLSTHPHVLAVTHPSLGTLPEGAVVIDEEFERETLSDRLVNNFDGAPATPISFDGLLSGNDNTEIELRNGTSGEAVAVQLADGSTEVSINWDNWSAIHLYTRISSLDIDGHEAFVSLGDDLNAKNLTEGFKITVQHDGGDSFWRVVSGGADQNTGRRPFTLDQPTTMGFSIEEDEGGNGHRITWEIDGQPLDEWNEASGWPSATGMTAQIGHANLTGVDRASGFDRFLVILVP